MLRISSRDNPLYKRVRRLLQGVDRRAVVLEGIHLCQDWLRHRGQPRHAIFDADALPKSPELQSLAQKLEAGQGVCLDSRLMRSLSPVAKAQGVVFVVHHTPPAIPERIVQACLWLDRIQDPGNVGTLLRTAAAAGLRHVYLSHGCAAAWSPRVLRSAQGAHFVLTLFEPVNLQEAAQRLAIPLYATALRDDSVSLYDEPIQTPCAWLFGNEGQGIDPSLLALAHRCIMIPQDPGVESLNVGVAAGVCLFEQRRQQRKDQR